MLKLLLPSVVVNTRELYINICTIQLRPHLKRSEQIAYSPAVNPIHLNKAYVLLMITGMTFLYPLTDE